MSTLQIACKYFGCEIEVDGRRHKMTSVSSLSIAYDCDGEWRIVNHGDWKPILKKLSDISNEDAAEVAELADLPESVRKDRYGCDSENMIYIGREIACDILLDLGDPVLISPDSAVAIIDFLRSRFYDLDKILKDKK